MADIFLSYAREDRAVAERLASAIEASGKSVWWDRHIKGGAQFSKDIERELKSAEHVLVLWSAAAVESRWVRDEATEGADDARLVGATIDGTPAPLGFRQFHTIDLQEWCRTGAALPTELAEAFGAEPAWPATGAGNNPAASTPARQRKTILVAAALAVVLAIVGAVYWMGGQGEKLDTKAEAATTEHAASLAVMPFRDLSPEQDQQWFSDGLAEEISTALSRVPDLYVAASSDAFALRDASLATSEIARRLRVEHVLGGSIRRAGDEMRITVELVRAADGERIWSQSYDRPTDDAISVQEDIATKVATALDTALDPEALAKMIETGTQSVEAYETLLRADIEGAWNLESSNAYLAEIDEAHRLDPDWALPLIEDAYTRYYRMTQRTYGFVSKEVALSDAKIFEEKIAQVLQMTEGSDKSADRLARERALAYRDGYNLRFKDAAARMKRLAKQYPNNPGMWYYLAIYAAAAGDRDTVFDALEKMVELQGPDGLIIAYYEMLGRWDRGVELSRQIMREGTDTHSMLRAGVLLAMAGETNEAMAAYRQIKDSDELPFTAEVIRIYAACKDGDLEEVRRLGEEFPDLRSRADFLLSGKSDRVERLAQYDRSEPPFMLVGWGYVPWDDMSGFPKTRKALEAAGTPHSLPHPAPFRCPGGYQGK